MIPRLKPGQEPPPGFLNRLIDAVNSAQITSADFPLERTTAGTRLSLPQTQPEFYAIITESPERQKAADGGVQDGEYEWAEVVLGEDGFEPPASPELALASHYDIDEQALYNPAYELNDNRRIEAGRIVRMKPYPPIEDPVRGFLRRYVFSAVEQPDALNMWVLTMQRWSKAAGQPHPYVWVRQCDIAGVVVWGPYIRVWLPDAAGQQPNVIAGEVLGAARMIDGTYSCSSDYLDEQFGVVDWFSGTVDDIRPGWELCDGQDGRPDLRHRFIMCVDPADDAGDGSEDAVGDMGGFRWHGLTENNHPNHTDQTGGTVVTAHPDHVHCGVDDGCFVSAVGGAYPAAGCTNPGTNGNTEIADGHVHEIEVEWFYKTGFNPGTYLDDSTWWSSVQRARTNGDTIAMDLTHVSHNHSLDLDHRGPFNAGKDTDNRPLFYVLAARVRIDNSA